jgi:cyclopropane fatty-acyl-phospholipid synthase-like methyltransferase
MTQEEFEKLYTSGYFKGEEYSDYLADKEITQVNFRARLKSLKKYLDKGRHKKLLEVGCAYGLFLNTAKDEFEEVTGVDVTQDGVDYAKNSLGLDAYRVDLQKWDFKNQKFDVACMWDTIEHLKRPDIYVEKIAENLNDGGLIAITTGDIESFVARSRKNKWRLIHPPTHAHYFSVKSLSQLLKDKGFKVVHTEHCGFYRSIDNIAYNIFVLRLKQKWIYNILKTLGITKINLYANLYDIMYLIAEKRPVHQIEKNTQILQ